MGQSPQNPAFPKVAPLAAPTDCSMELNSLYINRRFLAVSNHGGECVGSPSQPLDQRSLCQIEGGAIVGDHIEGEGKHLSQSSGLRLQPIAGDGI